MRMKRFPIKLRLLTESEEAEFKRTYVNAYFIPILEQLHDEPTEGEEGDPLILKAFNSDIAEKIVNLYNKFGHNEM